MDAFRGCVKSAQNRIGTDFSLSMLIFAWTHLNTAPYLFIRDLLVEATIRGSTESLLAPWGL